MSTLLSLLTLSGLLGLTSYGAGILPLSFTFSETHMSRLSSLGTGLLLGAALGVIIPEGIEELAHSRPSSTELEGSSIAVPLLFGFTFMLIVEQLSSSHVHRHHRPHRLAQQHPGCASPDSIFDVELAGLPDETVVAASPPHLHPRRVGANDGTGVTGGDADGALPPPSAYPITVGLLVHGLADGLALGMSVLSSGTSSHPHGLSLVVFLALAVHKAPTSLAYSVSLMSTSLSRAECKRHLLSFSASTPVGAIASYMSLSFLGAGKPDSVGIALLVSAGSFLYVATVLQPISLNRSSSDGVGTKTRILLLVLGIVTPFVLGTLLDHSHDRGTVVVPP
ncbi:Zinc/iron permease [Russula earlei]|uniref:Zinc/iron permease n=1 Tax=Russula earlei TaxID=71964 RepID=A0ACC0ULK1_9AGAM|nr:Zinc/iron permease [Russula earlei]